MVCALGGSGLLAALGLAHTVRDWDLTTDEPLGCLIPLVADLELRLRGRAASTRTRS